MTNRANRFPAVHNFTFKAYLTLLTMFTLLLATAGSAHAITSWYSTAGSHTLVLHPDGTVWTLGSNSYGQLGNGQSGGESLEPGMVFGLNNVKAVAAGGSHSVALLQDGTVWTWGHNGTGQLGIGSKSDSDVPVQVKALQGITAIAAGRSHAVALRNDGTVWSWGSNYSGQLGNNGSGASTTPVQAAGLGGVKAIAAGAFHTAALKSDGSVWTWGFNGIGQLGIGNNESSNVPARVDGLANVVAIASGNNHMVALKDNGSVWAWGSNYASQLGDGSDLSGLNRPLQVSGIGPVMDITAKVNHSLALMKDGSVMAWGDNSTGQWGNGSSMSGSSTPVKMHGVSSAITVAAVGRPDTLVTQESGPMVAENNSSMLNQLSRLFW